MDKSKVESMLNDYMKAYSSSYKARDDQKMHIAFKKTEYEETLDKMWGIYMSGNMAQIVDYNKQLDVIKSCGCKVYRNSQGKHMIKIA